MSDEYATPTQFLRAWRGGDARAVDQLLPLVYDQLRMLARRALSGERPGHTLQSRALVHEAYLRLVEADVPYADRTHFLTRAARTMRRVLVIDLNEALVEESARIRRARLPANHPDLRSTEELLSTLTRS